MTSEARKASAMTVANIPVGHTWPSEHWELTLTLREAARLGISKTEYESAALYARTTTEEHQHLGTTRDRWEPTVNLNDKLAAPYLANGEQELAYRLES